MADRVMLLSGARREDRRVELTAEDMPSAYRLFRMAVTLAKG
jgi:hypothetical protein